MSESDCLFCKIANSQVKAEIIAEEDSLIAFKDINPQAPTHLVVIPKEHIARLDELHANHTTMIGKLFHFINRLATQYQLNSDGYRVVVNCGEGAGQTVFHLHFHLLGGRQLQWPPG